MGPRPARWDALFEAGAGDGLVPVGLGARDTLRLEAGMPLYGNELDRDHDPYEAGLGRVVKLDKAGRLRRSRRARAARRDGPRQRLVGLTVTRRGIARHGYPVHDGAAGPASSPAARMSPTLGEAIAMAYVAPGRCRTGYDAGRSRSATSASARRGRAAAVLQAAVAEPVRTPPSRPGRSRRTGHLSARRSRQMVPPTCATRRTTSGSASRATRPRSGITEYAADQLGDVVFVELPGRRAARSPVATFGVVESVKAVSDLFAPVAGEVIAVNDALAATPELVNSDPYGGAG